MVDGPSSIAATLFGEERVSDSNRAKITPPEETQREVQSRNVVDTTSLSEEGLALAQGTQLATENVVPIEPQEAPPQQPENSKSSQPSLDLRA